MELIAQDLVREVPDFPKQGILFSDITPVLPNGKAFRQIIDLMTDFARSKKVEVVVGIESRGFIFGTPIAINLGVGFVPVRKLGKLPAETIQFEYALEYGTNTVEIHRDAIHPGQRVLVVDDLLATGGTAAATVRLVEQLGGVVSGIAFAIELEELKGRSALKGYDLLTLLKY